MLMATETGQPSSAARAAAETLTLTQRQRQAIFDYCRVTLYLPEPKSGWEPLVIPLAVQAASTHDADRYGLLHAGDGATRRGIGGVSDPVYDQVRRLDEAPELALSVEVKVRMERQVVYDLLDELDQEARQDLQHAYEWRYRMRGLAAAQGRTPDQVRRSLWAAVDRFLPIVVQAAKLRYGRGRVR